LAADANLTLKRESINHARHLPGPDDCGAISRVEDRQ
jgi:hypothetical protein